MYKSILVGGVMTIVGLSVPTTVMAQFQVPLSSTVESSQASQPAVSPLELQQFVQVIKQFQKIEMQTQQQMAKAIGKEGLTPQRFVEINESQRNRNPQANVSSDELDKFKKAVVKVNEIMNASETKRQRTVETQGLELKRFLEIESTISQNKALQARVQQMLEN
ncbi:DUF4168 domain-containing protein [Crocosphaera sp. UHCC 0190]|uniref:DUF4168 domain-containing protein n=1 Tax=Crocosphaera sp. UHCC 0190 TaxID=3110246 RepID=UPI002B20FF01|nr:DUF4168 domain-containing protein [Crocosphaera sp. UHCC 0190]MEA5509844.1 DUF4168 domain-containing protein [Crocosphaera sp. UHCC 0190]